MLTAERAREMLTYNPDTGAFVWKVSAAQRIKPGTEAGGLNKEGYVRIRIGGRLYAAHRLAWLVTYGTWPQGEIDHINGLRHDNRLCNLRDLTKAQNAQNRVNPSRHNKSGIPGVHWFARGKKWMARITVAGKRQSLGLFATLEDARTARIEAEKQFLTHAPNRASLA